MKNLHDLDILSVLLILYTNQLHVHKSFFKHMYPLLKTNKTRSNHSLDSTSVIYTNSLLIANAPRIPFLCCVPGFSFQFHQNEK